MTGDRGEAPATVFLAVCWIAAGLITAVMVLLFLFALGNPSCSSDDTSGQRVAQVIAVLAVAAIAGVWIGAAALLRSPRLRTWWGRALLGVALPVTLVVAFVGADRLMTAGVDLVAESSDHAMCW